jgi:hypothetical protein
MICHSLRIISGRRVPLPGCVFLGDPEWKHQIQKTGGSIPFVAVLHASTAPKGRRSVTLTEEAAVEGLISLTFTYLPALPIIVT